MAFSKSNAVVTNDGTRAQRFWKMEDIIQAVFSPGQDAIRTEPIKRATAPSNSAPITAVADITIAAGQTLFIQNLGVNPLFVRRGTGATSSLFNYVLQAAGANDDGTGGSVVIDDFIGVVSFAGTSVRYNAWKS